MAEHVPLGLLMSWGLKMLEGQKDGNDFYRHISEELYEGSNSNPKSARNEICKFQRDEKWEWYFQLLCPRNFENEENANDIFVEDVKLSERNYEPPAERDIFAAATKLGTDIYVLSEVENADGDKIWKWFHFLPADNDKSASKYLMFIRLYENRKINFHKLEFNCENENENEDSQNSEQVQTDDCDTEIITHEKYSTINLPNFLKPNTILHINCHIYRFKQGFLNKIPQLDSNSQIIPESEIWSQDADCYKTFSLFRCLSKELYGTEKYYKHLLQTSLDYQLLDENYLIFSGFTEIHNNASEKEKIKVLKQKLNKVKDGSSPPNKGEIYAAATVLKTTIFVCEDLDENKWEMFLPLTCIGIGNSFISLRKKEDVFYRLCPRSEECSCLLSPPIVMGHTGKIQQDLFGYIDQKLATEKRCCWKGRHKRHGHLKELVKSTLNEGPYETQNLYLDSVNAEIENVICSLKAQNRKLDQIQQGGGSLYHCISKEIYATDDHFKDVRDEMLEGIHFIELDFAELLQVAAKFISRPIYVFQRMPRRHNFQDSAVQLGWSCYLPRETYNIETNDNPSCRYYVTLYYNQTLEKFDRIVPEDGCNCQHRPPMALIDSRRGTSQSEILLKVQMSHEPMVEFFMDKLKDEDFQNQSRNIVMPHPFYETFNVLQRSDMSNRCIDQVKLDSNSFYRCLSKEIFGTELNYAIIREMICLEMEECKDIIGHILCERNTVEVGFFQALRSKTYLERIKKEKAFENRMEMIKNDSEADDVEILAAATFLQTQILVLSLDHTGKTSWMKFEQLRRKPRPKEMPVRQSFCRKSNKADQYYVTLLRTSSGHYDRIVPKTENCNCLIEPPACPTPIQGKTPNITPIERRTLKIARQTELNLSRIRICLNDWQLANDMMIQLCETITNRLETRREKVNVASIAGSATGLVGGVLAIAGLALGPVTFGAAFGLQIAGGVVGGVGGLAITGSKFTEAICLSREIKDLNVCRDKFKKKVELLQEEMKSFTDKFQELDQEANGFLKDYNQDVIDLSKIQSLLGLIKVTKNLVTMPLVVLRISLPEATIASRILAPLAVIFDVGFISHAVWNLTKGSKTNVSENLRRVTSQLKAARAQMKIWSYGNLKISSGELD